MTVFQYNFICKNRLWTTFGPQTRRFAEPWRKAGYQSPGGLLATQVANPTPSISDSVSLGQGQIICIFNKFLGDADVAESRGFTENHWPKICSFHYFLLPLFTDIDYLLSQSFLITELFIIGFRAFTKKLNIGR